MLVACLAGEATAADAARLLAAWGRINGEWGGVTQADVLPGRGTELIVGYHADPGTAGWNPRGRLLVLQRTGQTWQVGFDGAGIQTQNPFGAPWDNWSYHILATDDVTGDGLADLLMTVDYSNGLHAGAQYTVLLTADAGGQGVGLRVVYREDTSFTRSTFNTATWQGRPAIQAVIRPGRSTPSAPAITRTLAFGGQSLTQVKEEIDPDMSTASGMTPDGAYWYAFDEFDGVGGSNLYSPKLGIYRLREGRLEHFDVPATVRALRAGPDGSLYAAAGRGVLRYRDGHWEVLADLLAGEPRLATQPFTPFDLAFGPAGDLWVSGIFSLAHYVDGRGWMQYDVPARRALVAPDSSVWADGWDGVADSDCCFTRLNGSTVVTYTHTAPLPVPPELQEQIRALHH